MIPATLTVASALAAGQDFVDAFAGLLILVTAITFGSWAIRLVPRMVRKATR